jgi:hypothetical protein
MPHLDHIIVLLPHASILSPPSWLTSHFTITPGGRHADNATENKLIIFRDGSYIELISFINDDPALRKGHWWGKKEYGIIDFAFTSKTLNAEESFEKVKERLEKIDWEKGEVEVAYESPRKGGRRRDDGVDVKWQVTFPVVSEEGYQRGELPFFCHDVTERELRVPFGEESVRHPSGVVGVKSLGVYVPEATAKTLGKGYRAIIGTDGGDGGRFETEPLKGEEGKVGFLVKEPEEEKQRKLMEKRGGLLLGDLVFYKEKESESTAGLKRIDGENSEVEMGGWHL